MAPAPECRILFEGRARDVRPGETLLGALARGEFPVLQRSIRYHRPRGPACGVGYCTGCLVRVNGRPNVRACRYRPSTGDIVRTENSWPSPRFDLLGALDFLFPAGIDTLRGFRRPAWATPLFHRVVRRLAGYGAAPDPASNGPPVLPPVRRAVDVAIVGAGESGRAVAQALSDSGLHVLLLDRRLTAPAVPLADLVSGTTVTFLPPPAAGSDPRFTLVGFEEPLRGVEIRARWVVVATGAYDASLLFGGNDLPGVVTADGAFALAPAEAKPPFRHALLVGGGARATEVMERLGGSVGAVVAPGAIDPGLVRLASDLEVPLYPRSLLLRAVGRSRVRGARLRARGGGAGFSVPCDAVILAHRRLPTPQLFFQAGARMEWRAGPAAYFPVLTPSAETSVPGLFAVGAAAGIRREGSDAAASRVARAIVAGVGSDGEALPREPDEAPSEIEGYYRELWREPRAGRWIACPCEDVLLREVEEAVERGYRGIEVVKRYSGLGTGLCQGRYCLPDALIVLSLLENRAPAEVGYITQRPPVVPTPLAAFASLDDRAPAPGAP